MFFDMIKKHIYGNVRVLHVENGNIVDCKGCSFKTCLYYGEKNSCFYGGAITEEVLPAIEKADIVIWLCPNYNDSVSAKLMAVINRMTVLYRKMSFHEKYIYGVIVSGSSGGDSVSSQLLNSLCINKGFRLPANFGISQIAYERGEVLKIPGIRCLGKKFAGRINNIIK
jgi:multimeric flavodoxin WrbA